MLNADVLSPSPAQPRLCQRTAPLARNRILLDMPADLQRAVLAKYRACAPSAPADPPRDRFAGLLCALHREWPGLTAGAFRAGKTAETGMLDARDLVGLTLVLGDPRASSRAVVQTPGETLRIPATTSSGSWPRSRICAANSCSM